MPNEANLIACLLAALGLALTQGANGALVMTAGTIARFLSDRPLSLVAPQWLMGTAMAALAVRPATDSRG